MIYERAVPRVDTADPGDLAAKGGIMRNRVVRGPRGGLLSQREDADQRGRGRTMTGTKNREREREGERLSSPPSTRDPATSMCLRNGVTDSKFFIFRKAEVPAVAGSGRPRRRSSCSSRLSRWTHRRRRSCCIRTLTPGDARRTCGSCWTSPTPLRCRRYTTSR